MTSKYKWKQHFHRVRWNVDEEKTRKNKRTNGLKKKRSSFDTVQLVGSRNAETYYYCNSLSVRKSRSGRKSPTRARSGGPDVDDCSVAVDTDGCGCRNRPEAARQRNEKKHRKHEIQQKIDCSITRGVEMLCDTKQSYKTTVNREQTKNTESILQNRWMYTKLEIDSNLNKVKNKLPKREKHGFVRGSVQPKEKKSSTDLSF
jgi:hypothetical protein